MMPHHPQPHPFKRQQGAVLVVALIMLVVLTLLGLAGMNTTQMEEKMAANSQELSRAFQAAETGVSEAFASPGSFSLTAVNTVNEADIGGSGTSYSADVSFRSWTAPPVGSGYSATSFRSAHFDIISTGNSAGAADTRAESVIQGGAYQIAPKF